MQLIRFEHGPHVRSNNWAHRSKVVYYLFVFGILCGPDVVVEVARRDVDIVRDKWGCAQRSDNNSSWINTVNGWTIHIVARLWHVRVRVALKQIYKNTLRFGLMARSSSIRRTNPPTFVRRVDAFNSHKHTQHSHSTNKYIMNDSVGYTIDRFGAKSDACQSGAVTRTETLPHPPYVWCRSNLFKWDLIVWRMEHRPMRVSLFPNVMAKAYY